MDNKSSVPRLKTKDELNQLEDKEDCVILEFDPYDDELELDLSKLTFAEFDDLHVIATKGKVACKDYPHSRHACATFPFRKTPHESHCELCYCYVCDIIAPCKKWVGKSGHCDAFDTEIWGIKRKLKREAVERKKEAYKDYPHPRYMCVEFPFEKTQHHKHCEMCFCYVCESTAPCEMWVGTSNHCLAINDEKWRAKRELSRREHELQAKQNVSVSGASIAIVQQDQSNLVRQEYPQHQEQQTSQTDSVGSSVDEEDDPSEPTKVFVGNLSRNVNSHHLAELFRGTGVVKHSVVKYDPRPGGCSLGFGLVTMGSREEAIKASRLLDGISLDGNVLTVKMNKGHINAFFDTYVGNLPWSVDSTSLLEFFSSHGYKVRNDRIMYDEETGNSRGYAFVWMNSEGDRQEAIKTLNGQKLDGRKIRLGMPTRTRGCLCSRVVFV